MIEIFRKIWYLEIWLNMGHPENLDWFVDYCGVSGGEYTVQTFIFLCG